MGRRKVLAGLLGKGRIQIVRSLLDMLYTPAELAEELGIDARMIYKAMIPAGLPVRREAGRIWIHGPEVARWLDSEAEAGKAKAKMPENSAYCFKCREARRFAGKPQEVTRGNRQLLTGKCTKCGTAMYKALPARRS